ncbi:type II toxin-antitoxin system RelE/ParE family toxin [Akkermansiaceae bacterium]|nr:type II toxin-antitoxin system RelE/ParE family toxin [Akkermansiaceae bacterium]MDB4143274.1 type II toxin-antitoxin system RelE/ParE family toxin [Akkermansiaceae bacterium]MDB4433767.1 type II toxin-antitoxin system RelE/ParE family toxin [Akkermansiaceae bacterium]MDB4545751.1 type II toxin-antitoxin system RelE/ParE family toxin [Akkermansiaceae bacterium]MDB4578267.1 type II toxin-antitoxin system RelE/ParE family toxin [Akkermansiaceae bacterium]
MILDFTDHAAADLQEVSEYTLATWGEEQEERYLKDLYRKFSEILNDPARWRFREELFPRCQVAAEGRHLVLFRIDHEVLLIVRILHSSMDLGRHIPDGMN